MSTPSLWQIQAPSRGHDRLRGDVSADVCIVGAGVTGGACAWRLLEHGLRPVVLDAREVAASASGRNGGFAVGSSNAAADRALGEMAAMAAELGVADAVRRRGSLWLGGGHRLMHLVRVVLAAQPQASPPAHGVGHAQLGRHRRHLGERPVGRCVARADREPAVATARRRRAAAGKPVAGRRGRCARGA